MEIKAAKTQKIYYYCRPDKESPWTRIGETEYFTLVEKHKNAASKVEHNDANQVVYMSYESPYTTPQPHAVVDAKPKGCMPRASFFAIVIFALIYFLIK